MVTQEIRLENGASFEDALPDQTLELLVKDPAEYARVKVAYEQDLIAAKKDLDRVREEEKGDLVRKNENALQENKRIESEQTSLREAYKKDQTRLEAKEDTETAALTDSEKEAAERAAIAGVYYDPHNPDGTGVFRAKESSRPEASNGASHAAWAEAAKLGLRIFAPSWAKGLFRSPSRTAPAAAMPPALGWILTLAVGCMIGISLGLLSRILETDTMGRHPIILLLFILIGCGSAVGSRFAIIKAWDLAARYERAASRATRFITKAIAFAISLFVIVADGYVEKCGLLRIAETDGRIGSLSGAVIATMGDDRLFWLAGCLVIFGFVVYHSITGFTEGQREARAEADAEQKKAKRAENTAAGSDLDEDPRLKDPKFQAAMKAISMVVIRRRSLAELKKRMEEQKASYQRQIEELEARRRPLCDTLSETSRQRIEAAETRLTEAKSAWKTMVAEALHSLDIRDIH